MGCNYYLRKKTKTTFPAYVGCCNGRENEPLELTNGIVWNDTYYPNKDACDDVFYQEFHIGKSSAGWYFNLAIYPEYGINNFEDWKNLFQNPQNEIYDEYGEKIDPQTMINNIINKGRQDWNDSPEAVAAWKEEHLQIENELNTKYHHRRPYTTYEELVADNHAVLGKKGLWRHQLDEYTSYPDNLEYTCDYILSGNDPYTGRIFC